MNETLVNDILKSGGTTLMVIKAEDLKKAICETVSETRRQMENEVAMSKSETYLTCKQNHFVELEKRRLSGAHRDRRKIPL